MRAKVILPPWLGVAEIAELGQQIPRARRHRGEIGARAVLPQPCQPLTQRGRGRRGFFEGAGDGLDDFGVRGDGVQPPSVRLVLMPYSLRRLELPPAAAESVAESPHRRTQALVLEVGEDRLPPPDGRRVGEAGVEGRPQMVSFPAGHHGVDDLAELEVREVGGLGSLTRQREQAGERGGHVTPDATRAG
ncbi:hypothetical protein ACQP2X_19405 [Actinoplanes sp. CA-131856]